MAYAQHDGTPTLEPSSGCSFQVYNFRKHPHAAIDQRFFGWQIASHQEFRGQELQGSVRKAFEQELSHRLPEGRREENYALMPSWLLPEACTDILYA